MRLCLVLTLLCTAACSGNDSSSRSNVMAPTVPACERDRTGTITVQNRGQRTADIIWNGAVIATLSPGQTSSPRTVVAGGAQYLLDQIVTNTTFHPCGTLIATPLQCQNNAYATCAFN